MFHETVDLSEFDGTGGVGIPVALIEAAVGSLEIHDACPFCLHREIAVAVGDFAVCKAPECMERAIRHTHGCCSTLD